MVPKVKKPKIKFVNVLACIIAILPAAIFFYFLTQNWVNVFYADEWEIYKIFIKFQNHTITLKDLFAQSNESRLVFPKIFLYYLGKITNWDTRAFMASSFLINCGSSLLLLKLLSKNTEKSSALRFFIWAIINFFIFAITQWEAAFSGATSSFYLPIFLLIFSLFFDQLNLSRSLKTLIISLCCIVATYTYANGMLLWVCAFPFQDVLRDLASEPKWNWKRLFILTFDFWRCVYLALAFVSIGFYFLGYQKPSQCPSPFETFHHPLLAIQYFLCWLSAPLIKPSIWCGCIVGTIILGLFINCYKTAIGLYKHSYLSCQLYPWLMIGLFSMTSGLIATIGRSPFGIHQAFSSRYIVFSIYVPIAIIGCTYILWKSWNSQDAPLLQTRRIFLIGLLLGSGLAFSSQKYANTIPLIKKIRTKRIAAVAYLPFIDSDPNNSLLLDLGFAPGWGPYISQSLHLYIAEGIIPNPFKQTSSIWNLEQKIKVQFPQPHDEHIYGSLDKVELLDGNNIQVTGWAADTVKNALIKTILFTATDSANQTVPIATIAPHTIRPDITEIFNFSPLLASGFNTTIVVPKISNHSLIGKQFIAAWAIDNNNQLHQIGAEFIISLPTQ